MTRFTSRYKSMAWINIIFGGLSAFGLLLPLFVGEYLLHLLIFGLLNAYLALCWNLIGGYAGQFSLAHSIFFGVGAYSAAMLGLNLGLTPWLGIWVGAILSFVIGGLIGFVCFRFGLKGFYFAVATLAMSEAFRGLAIGLNLGGLGGKLQIALKPSALGFVFQENVYYYYIILALFGIGILITYFIERSKLGYYIQAIRENEEAAEAQGVNTFLCKVLIFGISGALTSLGGTFHAQYVLYIHPDMQFSLSITIQMFLACFIGGKGTILGPILGSFGLSGLDIALRTVPVITADVAILTRMAYGIIMILSVIFLPQGFISLMRKMRKV